MKVTLKQIAEEAGVSINTVSIALRNMPGISATTRDEIFKIAEKLKYFDQKRKPDIEQNLCLIATESHFKDSYFYMTFHQLILSKAHEQGYNMIILNSDSCDTTTDELKRLFNNNSIGGILLLGDMQEEIVSNISKCGLPIVAIGSRYHNLNICTFIEDNFEAAFHAVKHLSDLGYRDIGFIGNPLYSTAFLERFHGFLGAMNTFGLSYKEENLLTKTNPNDLLGQSCFTKSIQNCTTMPQAFFCANDYLGMVASKALHNIGLLVPKDVALIGIDNSSVGKMMIPSLASIDVRCELQANLSIEKLISFMQGHQYEPLRFLTPVSLTLGESVIKQQI